MIRSALLATLFALALTACGEKPAEEMPAVEEMTEEMPAVEEMTEEAPAVEEMIEEAVEEVPAAE